MSTHDPAQPWRSDPWSAWPPPEDQSLSFKSLARKFQCAAVLGHCANNLIGCATRNFCLDLQCDLDGQTHQPSEMGNDLVGDAAGVAAHPGRIERDAAMKASGAVFWRLAWRLTWLRIRSS